MAANGLGIHANTGEPAALSMFRTALRWPRGPLPASPGLFQVSLTENAPVNGGVAIEYRSR